MSSVSRAAFLLILCSVGLPCVWGAEGDGALLRNLYDSGEYERAVEFARSTDGEHSADFLIYHGLALARLERYEEAQTVLEGGRGRYPGDKRFPLELAGVAYRRKRLGMAKSHLRRALGIDGEDEYGNEFLGSLHLIEGNVAAALKYWNRIGKPVIQDVTVTPPGAVHAVLRERSIAISGGQIFTLARLRATERNLERLGIFSRRRIELAPRQDERYDVAVRLLPAGPMLTGWAGRVLPLARSLPYEAAHFDTYNIARRAINFRSLWRWDSNKRRIDLELAGPVRMTPRYGFRAVLDMRDENWDLVGIRQGESGVGEDLKLRKAAFGGDLSIAATPKLEWTTGLRMTNRGFANDDGSAEFGGGWAFEQRNELRYPLVDLPERRVRVNSAARLRTGRVFTGARSRFGIVEGDLAASWRPEADDDAWEAQARLRGGKTFGGIPFDEFFQLGMERDNDLWLRGHVGTREGKKGNAPLGTDYALLQTEFDRRAARVRFLEFRVGPFFDAGRIGGGARGLAPDAWLFDAGVQAKVAVAGGITWSVVYGRDLRDGRGVFYTAVRY